MGTTTLTELRDKLYIAFDRAIERSEHWDDSRNAPIESAKAAADIARAIVAVETRLDERETGPGLKLPGKP